MLNIHLLYPSYIAIFKYIQVKEKLTLKLLKNTDLYKQTPTIKEKK